MTILLSYCLMLRCFHGEDIYAVNDDDQSDVEYVYLVRKRQRR